MLEGKTSRLWCVSILDLVYGYCATDLEHHVPKDEQRASITIETLRVALADSNDETIV